MLGIELSALSVPELKRLLEVARTRQQHALARALVAELEARPGRMAGLRQAPEAMTELTQSAPTAPRRRRGPAVAVAASSAVLGAVLAWGLSAKLDVRPPPPAPQPVIVPAADPDPWVAVALTSLQPESGAPFDPAIPGEASSPPAAGEPDMTAAPVRLIKARAAPTARSNPCLSLPTARERLICGYPSIAIQDNRLKQAYARALAAGADRRAIDRAQAEWREASAEISDRKVLLDRYDRRIRELEAVAAQPRF